MSQPPPHRPRFPTDSPGFHGNGACRSGSLPRCQLVLVNNSSAELMMIVRALMELIHFCRDEATHKMWEAHHWGRSILLLTHRERAELYVEQFAEKGLIVTVEPDKGK